MTDIVDNQTRSRIMSRIRGKDTKPELLLRKGLFAAGFRYRLHAKLPGKPDLLLPKHNAAIFVHGCFWHRHPGCRYTTNPDKDAGKWQAKFAANVLRDGKDVAGLRELGWRVAIVWACSLRRNDLRVETILATAEWIRGEVPFIEIGEAVPRKR